MARPAEAVAAAAEAAAREAAGGAGGAAGAGGAGRADEMVPEGSLATADKSIAVLCCPLNAAPLQAKLQAEEDVRRVITGRHKDTGAPTSWPR